MRRNVDEEKECREPKADELRGWRRREWNKGDRSHDEDEGEEKKEAEEEEDQWMISSEELLREHLPRWVLSLSKSFVKNFAIGFTWQLLVQAFPFVLRGKFSKLNTLFDIDNFKGYCQRGALLGVWVTQFRLLMKLVVGEGRGDVVKKFKKGSPQHIRHCNNVALCGFLAGACAMFLVGGLTWSMALYFACRALRGVIDVAYTEHLFPEWYEKLPTWLLFAIICGPTASHPLLFKANYVPRGYFDFIGAAASMDVDKMNYMYLNSFEKIQPCHPIYHKGPCLQSGLKSLRHSLSYAMKFYMIFYSITRVLLRSPKQLLNSPIRTVRSIIRNSIGSSLFVSSVGWAACRLPCIYRPFVGRMNFWNVIPYTSLTALGLCFEAPSRQSELIVYNISSTIEGFVNYFYDLNVRIHPPVPTPPILSKVVASLLFGIGSAAWVWVRQRSPKSMKRTEKKILNHVLPLEPKYVTFDETSENPLVINDVLTRQSCQLLTEDGEMQEISIQQMDKLLEENQADLIEKNPLIMKMKAKRKPKQFMNPSSNRLMFSVCDLLITTVISVCL